MNMGFIVELVVGRTDLTNNPAQKIGDWVCRPTGEGRRLKNRKKLEAEEEKQRSKT